jgi:hypothetical protein
MGSLPQLISVDDHVVEPPDLWWSRLPADLRLQAPHVRREKGTLSEALSGRWVPGDDGHWADVWYYEDQVRPLQRGLRAGPVLRDHVVRGRDRSGAGGLKADTRRDSGRQGPLAHRVGALSDPDRQELPHRGLQ